MARPVKFSREKAVELAMNEIWRNGYEACSVKALSEKLGITRSSFYNAFGSKEGLFTEALELYASRSPDRILSDTTPGSSVRKIITNAFRAICKARAMDPQSRGCMAVNGITELCGSHQELGGLMGKALLGSTARIETLLRRGVAQNEIPTETDLRALALALQNLMVGLNVMSQVVHDEQELWKVPEVTLRGLNLLAEDAP